MPPRCCRRLPASGNPTAPGCARRNRDAMRRIGRSGVGMGGMMKEPAMSRFVLFAVAFLGLAACGTSPGERAVTGGLLGAGAGAGVGAVTGGNAGTGALIGAGVGAAGGALTAPRRY